MYDICHLYQTAMCNVSACCGFVNGCDIFESGVSSDLLKYILANKYPIEIFPTSVESKKVTLKFEKNQYFMLD